LPVGRVTLAVDGKEEIVPVVFGPEDTTPLLGAIALEALLMAADPVNKQLVPVTGKLL
jgi:hypothetical protein